MNFREVTVQVDAAVPPDVVWAAMTDWSRQHEWMLGTRVYVVAGDGRSVGSRLLGFTGFLDIGFADILEITVWDPPRLCRVRHLGKLLRGTAEFGVQPAGAGSVIVWTERLELPFALVGPLLAGAMRASLRRLSSRLR